MEDDEILQAKKKAMSLLLHNDRTEWELTDRLIRAGFSAQAVHDAVEYVRGFHYIDDRRYAERFAQIYHSRRSIQRIKQDLNKRHIPDEYIEMAISEIEGGDSEAIQKEIAKLTHGKADFSYEEKQKIIAKLYRKGFRLEDIRRFLDL